VKFNSYQETIDWLFQQFPSYQSIGAPAYKPGLENIYHLLDVFGNPQNDLKFIHVAGTNGKGSTCSMLASFLKEKGETVGLFTSPHIRDFRERIRVNGEVTTEEFVMQTTQAICDADLNFEPSFFEITFLMSLLYFKLMRCTICVIETGLGGRLDATNCVNPLVSVITNIGLEHTQYLGDTLDKIALEKGGIIKDKTPVVIGEVNDITLPVFEELAHQYNAPLHLVNHTSIAIPANFPLLGAYQQKNYRLVKTTLDVLKIELSEQELTEGLLSLHKNSGFYGRLQVVQENPRVIFDVSHNVDGIKATLDYFKHHDHLCIVYGTSADKDMDAIFDLFNSKWDYFFTEFKNSRSAKIDQLRQFSEKNNLSANFFQNSFDALNAAKVVANKEDTILVFGSFFLISDFF